MGDHAQLSDTLSPDGIKGKKQGSEQSTIIKPEAPDIGFPKGALDKDDQNLNLSTQSLCESDNNQEDENENQDPNQRYLSTKIPYQNSNCIFTHKPSCTTDQNECPKNDQASAATN